MIPYQNKIIVIISILVALYAAFVIMSDITSINEKIQNFELLYTPIILALMLISWVCLFFMWHFLLKNQNIDIPKKKNFFIFCSSFALSLIPGKIGELIKPQLLKKNFDIPIKSTAPIVFVEQIYVLIGLVIISFLGIWLFDIGLIVISIFGGILVLLLILIKSRKLFEKVFDYFSTKKFVGKYVETFSVSYDVLQNATNRKTFVLITGLSILYWFIECLMVYLVFQSFGIDIEFLLVIPTYLSSILLGAASFLPLGIGVVESSLAGFFSLIGIETSIALTLVIVVRIFTRWISVAFGFISLKFCGGYSLK